MSPDLRGELRELNSDWPYVVFPLMGLWFLLGVGMPVPGDPYGPGSHASHGTPYRVSAATAVSIPIAGER
jgi:hypothetical protein